MNVVPAGNAIGNMIATFSLNAQGEFSVADLPAGPYVLRVEPLDDADTDSFFDGILETSFRVTYFSKLVVAPRHGDSGAIEIRVTPK